MIEKENFLLNCPSSEYLESQTSNIFTTELFKTETILSENIQKYMLAQYYYYIDNFPQMLTLALLKCSTDEQRLPIISNLWEEHGSGDLNQSHRALYKQLLLKLNIELTGCTSQAIKNVISESNKTIEQYNYNDALVFLSYGIEYTTPILYTKVLEKINMIPKDRNFFQVHIEDDDAHYHQLAEHISFKEEPFLNAIKVEKDLWAQLYEEAKEIYA